MTTKFGENPKDGTARNAQCARHVHVNAPQLVYTSDDNAASELEPFNS